jgi:hypothetical protein
MSSESNGLDSINPKDTNLKLGDGTFVSLSDFTDKVQRIPSFPSTIECYQMDKRSIQVPNCGTCSKPLKELYQTRDNGWSCSGLKEPNGCLSKLKCNQNTDQNTGGWNRWRCFDCDFDYCDLCCERSIKNSQQKIPLKKRWRYTLSSDPKTASAPIKTIDIRHNIIHEKFPLFFLLANNIDLSNFFELLRLYIHLPSSSPGTDQIQVEQRKEFQNFHQNTHIFLAVAPEFDHSRILSKFNMFWNDNFTTMENSISFDILSENGYSKISTFFHNTSAVFTVRFSCSKICDIEKNEEGGVGHHKENSRNVTKGPRLGIRLLKMPSTRTGEISTLIGNDSIFDWLHAYRGMFALKYLFLWSQHGISKEKKILSYYAKLASSMLNPSSELRNIKLYFPLTTAFQGSNILHSKQICDTSTCPLILRLKSNDEFDTNIRHSLLLCLPIDLLAIICSFLYNDLVSIRYTMTTCKRFMLPIRSLVYKTMNINHVLSDHINEKNINDSKSKSNDALFLNDIAEENLKKCNHLTTLLSKYRTASKHLSMALVTLGIPHRMLWRMNAHKSRGNAEFEQKKYGRALCHYLLVFTSMSKLSIYFDSDFVTEKLINDYGHTFNFTDAVKYDNKLLFTVQKILNDKDTNCFGIDEVFKEFDERILGFTSKASSELDYINITCLQNASLCLLKLNLPDYALQFAKYSKKTPIDVKGWRGQHGVTRSLQKKFKSDIRIGQALAAMQRWDEAKDVYRQCINKFRHDTKITKRFRKLLIDLQTKEKEWKVKFSNKLNKQNKLDEEKKRVQNEKEQARKVQEDKDAEDDIF